MKNKKQKVLDALLDARSIKEAAEKAGTTRATVYTYLEDASFVHELQALQRRILLSRADDIAESRGAALAVIRSIMDDKEIRPEVRLQAARSILAVADSADRAAMGALADCEIAADPIRIY